MATILFIGGILSGIVLLWGPAMIGLASGVGLYVMGQMILAKREHFAKMDEQIKGLKAIRELIEQNKT